MDQPKSSLSFRIAVAALVVAVVGFGGWYFFLKPNPVGQSEWVVRSFSEKVAAKRGPFRSAVRDIQRNAGDTPELRRASLDRIDQLAREFSDAIEDLTDAAILEIEMIQGIGLRTQENRLSRIRRLSLEGRASAGQIVAEAKAAIEMDAARERE